MPWASRAERWESFYLSAVALLPRLASPPVQSLHRYMDGREHLTPTFSAFALRSPSVDISANLKGNPLSPSPHHNTQISTSCADPSSTPSPLPPPVENQHASLACPEPQPRPHHPDDGNNSNSSSRSSRHDPVAQATLQWVRSTVIGLNLCPWAAGALVGGHMRVLVHPPAPGSGSAGGGGGSLDGLARAAALEATALGELRGEAAANATTLLVARPPVAEDFGEFLEVVETVETFLDDAGLRGAVQARGEDGGYMYVGEKIILFFL